MLKNREHHLVYWALFAAALLVRGFGNASQPPLADEVAAAFAADNYLDHGILGQVMWYHPPLRNFVIYISGKVFGGYSAWGLRGGSILMGSLSVPLLGYLGYALFRNAAIGGLAAFFLCVDPLHIALSRQAFQETTTPFFILLGALLAFSGMKNGRTGMLYFSGICFGLATASKWHGIFPWIVCSGIFLSGAMTKTGVPAMAMHRRVLIFLSAFIALPIVVYVASYIPWLARGNSLPEFADFQLWLVKRQYIHRASEYAESFLVKRAVLWFVWPTAWVSYVFHEGKSYLNIAMGNFLVWVMTLPSLFLMTRLWLKGRAEAPGFLLLLFGASYLPLVLTSRSVYVFSAPAVIPFAFLLIAASIYFLREQGKISGKSIAAYLAVVVILSALMYPLSTMKALAYPWLSPFAEIYNPHRTPHE